MKEVIKEGGEKGHRERLEVLILSKSVFFYLSHSLDLPLARQVSPQ